MVANDGSLDELEAALASCSPRLARRARSGVNGAACVVALPALVAAR